MNNISCENIYKSFIHENEEMSVLENINISINKKETIAITGPSGSGKSTMLQLLAGLDKPTKGNVSIDSQNIQSLSELKKSELRLNSFGFVYQFHHLLEDLNVFENILIPQQLQNINASKDSIDKVNHLLDDLGLTSRATYLPWKLSGGEKQRVAIARAIINDPEFLFLDEPTGNLDDKNSEIVQDLIMSIAKEYEMTLILSTHDKNFANKMNTIYKINNKTINEV
jgi:lipoprotein-releasing system ATP-binding protein|tara:strand:+ start:512 stop:1189 length:678 start_codon:yes stop_codon:yes gene_type:complete